MKLYSGKSYKVRQSLAAANVVNLGVSASEAASISESWLKSRIMYGNREAMNLVFDEAVSKHVSIAPSEGGRLYVSFHYSLYALMYWNLGASSAERKVFAITKKQPDDHVVTLRKLGHRYGFEIEFIEEGRSVIRKARAAISSGCSAIILIDLPSAASPQEKSSARFEVSDGTFFCSSALVRILSLIDPNYGILYVDYVNGNYTVNSLPSSELSDAFAQFRHMLKKNAADYEGLEWLHGVFRSKSPKNCLSLFFVGDELFAFHPGSSRSWKIASNEVRDKKLSGCNFEDNFDILRSFETILGEKLDVLLSI